MDVTRDAVLAALARVVDPASGRDLVAADLVRALVIADGKVRFVLEVANAAQGARMEPVRAAAVAAVEELTGPGKVQAVVTAPAGPKPPPPDLKIGRHPTPQAGPQPIPGVKTIVPVASGKGGVGKSTVAANLAVALAAMGKRVGLLDADVYGPSQPRMMGISGRPGAGPDGKTILPLHGHGVTVMSLGFMMPEGEAVVWRGPMLMGALQQFLGQVEWGELDVLIVDLPPGTGDVQLTLTQKAPVTGAVVVSTPQDVALLDARKALHMFEKTGTPVLGLIENMSAYHCPNCGHEAHLFGHGGARAEAAARGLPFLGEVPITLATRIAGDEGRPVVLAAPDSAEAAAFRQIAERVAEAAGF
ncbi:Mrp/NBP35 family ATP-binding protein [Frigidibacter sp. ROC022]|uniref:Mrp/NBP35 family ATP-binding protein n=1 Tax=Frigidibacter sp. ROC022 TaxID=2971796 RepID=UPI00215A15C6|nr:Mrp/NBP35 family ATP-binding protein [Frigidibacter sp. ROC022]MCR8723945.1 Mrp/NBP35 family ATP-binding protein [Frigidibacter sp. ROC022]